FALGSDQGWTDNSWGPRAIGDHGAPVSLPKLKKSYENGTRGISWDPLLTRVSKWSVRPWLQHCPSVPPISVHQCGLSVPITAASLAH
ncbi:unnamed protein product, partial [Staurois parvus]